MKKRDYDTMYDKYTGNTETRIATDEHMALEDANIYEEGFASASGVRADTASSGGRIRHSEEGDAPYTEGRVDTLIDDENSGLADN